MRMELSTDLPELVVPDSVIARIEGDRNAGVEVAFELINRIRESRACSGVHLISVGRYREMAARLEAGK
jgi:methylenetetrahydrofolate reductase (NADPH)